MATVRPQSRDGSPHKFKLFWAIYWPTNANYNISGLLCYLRRKNIEDISKTNTEPYF